MSSTSKSTTQHFRQLDTRRRARRQFAQARSYLRAARIMQRCGGGEERVGAYAKAARQAAREGNALLRSIVGGR